MGLALLVLGLALFLGPHVFVTLRGARGALIARIGEGLVQGTVRGLSIVGLYLIGKGFALYRDAGMIEVWDPPDWTRHITVALMWPSIIFVTAAYIPGDIKRVLKHPMLVGVKLWAVAHLISNGDLGSMIIFISVLAWAVYDRITLKRRSDPGWAADPDRRPPQRHRRGDRRHDPLFRPCAGVPSAGDRKIGAVVRPSRTRNLIPCRPTPTRSG